MNFIKQVYLSYLIYIQVVAPVKVIQFISFVEEETSKARANNHGGRDVDCFGASPQVEPRP